jgi:hypothetical protein
MKFDDPEPGLKSVHRDQQDTSHPTGRVRDDLSSADAAENLVIESRAQREPTLYPQRSSAGSGIPRIVHPENGSRVGSTLTLCGTSPANSIVAVLDGMEPVAAAESDDIGYWTATVNRLTPGNHQLYVRILTDGSTQTRSSTSVAVVVSESTP